LENKKTLKSVSKIKKNVFYISDIATLPCNLSLMACFGEINVSPGNVQHMQGAVGFLMPVYLQIYQRNLPVKIFLKSVKI